MAPINHFDLAFIVDTTGSMGGLISAAQKQMVQMVEQLSSQSSISIRFGVVEYRDHPPQDKMIFKAFDLTDDLHKVRKTLLGLKADGGGDAPEAVFAGIVAATEALSWRTHSRRMAMLVGDAPPHGVGYPGDAFRDGCPSGETIESVSAKAEEHRMTLYSLGLHRICEPHFEKISRLTGGQYFRSQDAQAAMSQINQILEKEFGEVELDRKIYDALVESRDLDLQTLAELLNVSMVKVSSSICRLQSRGILSTLEYCA